MSKITRELEGRIANQAAEMEALKKQIEQSNNSNEGKTSQIIAIEAKFKQFEVVGKIFAEDGKKMFNNIKMKQFNNYHIPAGDNYPVEYWYRINRREDGFANYAVEGILKLINETDDIYKEEMLRSMAKYGKMFGYIAVQIEGDNAVPCVIAKGLSPRKVEAYPITLIGDTGIYPQANGALDGSKLAGANPSKKIIIEDGVNGAIFKPTDIGIGDYVLMIPGICKIIYFERQKQRNISFANIIPSINIGDKEINKAIAAQLTDSDAYEFHTQTDGQVTSENIAGEPVTYIVPPEQIKEFFEVLEMNADTLEKTFCQEFGIPIKDSKEQELNANANLGMSQYEFKLKGFTNAFIRFLKKLEKLGGISFAAAKAVEEHVEKEFQKEEPQEDNDNASKDEPKTGETQTIEKELSKGM